MTTESEADFENDDTLEYPSHDEHISEESYIEQIERERDELKETVLRKQLNSRISAVEPLKKTRNHRLWQ